MSTHENHENEPWAETTTAPEKSLTGQLTTLEAIKHYMFAGNATITLVSEKTSTRYTYRIKQSDKAWLYFVSLLAGPDNEHSYTYMGLIRNGVYEHGRKSKIGADANSARAYAWFSSLVEAGKLPPALEVWHEGRCGRCNRKLTVPESVERGIGPECAGIMSAGRM